MALRLLNWPIKYDLDPARSLRISYSISSNSPSVKYKNENNESGWFNEDEIKDGYFISVYENPVIYSDVFQTIKVSYSFVLTPWRPKRKRFPEKKFHISTYK